MRVSEKQTFFKLAITWLSAIVINEQYYYCAGIELRLPLTSAYKRELAKLATRLLKKKGAGKLDYVTHAQTAA